MPTLAADRVDHTLPAGHALPRGWQAYAIFGLLPLWWLLGLSMFMWPLITLPLLGSMVLGRWRVVGPRRFGIFLLLIGWMVVAGLQLSDGQRIMAWAWRGSFFVAGAILFLYLLNMPERRLPTRSIVNALAFYWVIVVAGGWFGVLFPTFQLSSVAQHVLPHSVVKNQYVYAHVHLQFAEVQHFLGFPVGRPETFFAYTNAWGSAFAILTPFAIASLLRARPGTWRMVLRITFVAAIVPVVFSLDRGLWLSLGLGVTYAAVRFALRRDYRLVGLIIGAFVCIAAALLVTPLGGLATGRFQHKTGDAGRLQRDQAATQKATSSPLLGYGAPLQNTVAGQSNIGTESEVFMLVFSFGFPGLCLFFLWFAYTLFRSAPWRTPEAFWAHVVILIALIQTPYYELTERLPLVMVAAAIAYREILREPRPAVARRRFPLPTRRRAAATT
ncbi:MAG: O-antigen ligase family protein [Gaiellales bacterium]